MCSIRAKLQLERGTRDFNLAIDSKLRGCDLVALPVGDVAPLDAKVADDTFDAGVAEQKLHRTQVPRAAVDQGRFGSTHGMRRIFEPVEANGRRCPRNRREDRGLNYRGRAAVLRPGGRSGQKVA